MTLDELNAMTAADAEATLMSCCGVTRWAWAMTAGRPYGSSAELLETADRAWQAMTAADWREAFRHHPRIGEQARGQRPEARSDVWSAEEQDRASVAADDTRAALAAINGEYERRFGHIFLTCATGKTAMEIVAEARARLSNDPARELQVAAEEQRKITQLRLRKLLGLRESVPT